MAKIIKLSTFSDNRGSLIVIEKEIPFNFKRIYYIYGVDNSERGKHRHKKTIQAAICISGKCEIYCNNGTKKTTYKLDSPNKCLILDPKDWHKMYNFSNDAILMVIASEPFDKNDYIFEEYK